MSDRMRVVTLVFANLALSALLVCTATLLAMHFGESMRDYFIHCASEKLTFISRRLRREHQQQHSLRLETSRQHNDGRRSLRWWQLDWWRLWQRRLRLQQ